MASYYVWSGAAGGGNGTTWVLAYQTLTLAFTGKAAGDVFYVAHDHAESTAAAITPTTTGTVANPAKVICANRAGSVPPVSADRRATAQVATTGNSNITFGGSVHYDGIIFTAGNSTGTAVFNFTSASVLQRFDNCSLRCGSSGASSRINVGNTSITGGMYIDWNNTTVSFAAVGQCIALAAAMKWRNTPSALLGTIPTNLFTNMGGGDLECIGVDLSAAGSGKVLVQGSSATTAIAARFRFVDCKTNASVTMSNVPGGPGAADIDFIRVAATGINYAVRRHRMAGLLIHELTIIRTGGATDGTTPLSWRIDTTADCNYTLPFECPVIAIWNDTTGSAVTATVEGIWGGGAVPLDDEVFLDCEFLGDASSPQGSFVNDGKADLLATAAAQAASSATWGAAGTTLNSSDKESHITLSGGNLTATGTAGWVGFVRAVQGKTSGKFYWEHTFNAAQNNSGVGVSINSVAVGSNAGFATVSTGHGGVDRVGSVRVDGGASITVGGIGASGIFFGTISSGTVICVAVDVAAKLIWFRLGAGGNWNNNASYNPATGVGGVSIPNVGTPYPTLALGGADNIVANFGDTAFTGAVPSGFTSGWPASNSAFKLSTTFTPQQKGWIYGRVKCAKPSSTFYIDPLVALS